MLRQPSSRNQRTRGFRLKQALQIGILVAVCIWLLYQVKHSHDKKRAYDARNSKTISKSVEDQEDFFKFGRKDLTRNGEAGTADEIHKEEESEEAQEEEEPEIKQEETEDEEMRGAGDDGTDEQSQKNVDEETERGEEGHMEEPDPFDSRDHEEGTQAREENYKSDDASSAVAHEAQATESETVKEDARSTDGEHVVDSSKGDTNSTSDGTKVDAAADNTERQQEMLAENAINGTVDGSEADNSTVDGSANNLSDGAKDNSTVPIDNNPANNGTAAEAGTSNPNEALVTNSTATRDEFDNKVQLSENQTEGQNNSTVVELPAEVQKDTDTVVDSAQDRNTTVVDKGTPVEGESNLGNVDDRAEKSDSTAALGSEEQSTTSSATNGTETDHDPTLAVSEDEREARTDLSTLPDIQNEARAMDDE